MFKSLKEKLSNLFSSKEEGEEKVEEKKHKGFIVPKEKKSEKNIKETPKKTLKKDIEDKTEETIQKQDNKISEENKQELEYSIDEVEKELNINEEDKKPNFFQKITQKGKTTSLDKETFEEFFIELENLLLENNVALNVVDKIKENMEKDLLNIEIKKSEIDNEIKNSLKKSISNILIEPFDIINKIKSKEGDPFIILFFGINGSGKTTTISKLTHYLKENKIPCVLAAGDTFRAASIEQLQKHGEKLGVKVISQNYGADPAAVAFDAVKYAKAHGIKAVLIDTAGRMHTKTDLLREMEKIIRVIKPDLKIFVAEAITGNDATEQADTFNKSFGIDASILTKADVDERGGTMISIGHVTKKPILFLGIGQEYKDLEKFSKEEIIANLGL